MKHEAVTDLFYDETMRPFGTIRLAEIVDEFEENENISESSAGEDDSCIQENEAGVVAL